MLFNQIRNVKLSRLALIAFGLVCLRAGESSAMRLDRNVKATVVVSGSSTSEIATFFRLRPDQASTIRSTQRSDQSLIVELNKDGSVAFETVWDEAAFGMGSRFFLFRLRTMSFRVSHYSSCFRLADEKAVGSLFAKKLPQKFEIEGDQETVTVSIEPSSDHVGFCLSISSESKELRDGLRE